MSESLTSYYEQLRLLYDRYIYYALGGEEKESLFENPRGTMSEEVPGILVELLDDPMVRYFESGEVLAKVAAKLNGTWVILEAWGDDAEWLACYAQRGKEALVEVVEATTVQGVDVAAVKIKLR